MNAFWSALQAILNGLLTGALYALIGMGMALIFGVMRIVNFAHGAFMMLGMYIAWVLFDRGIVSPYEGGFLIAAATLFVVGFLVYRFLLQRISGKSDFMQILLTLGLALIIVDGIQLIFGADYHQISLPILDKNVHFGPHITLNAPWLISFGITVVLAIGMFLFVMRSRFGRALRAI